MIILLLIIVSEIWRISDNTNLLLINYKCQALPPSKGGTKTTL